MKSLARTGETLLFKMKNTNTLMEHQSVWAIRFWGGVVKQPYGVRNRHHENEHIQRVEGRCRRRTGTGWFSSEGGLTVVLLSSAIVERLRMSESRHEFGDFGLILTLWATFPSLQRNRTGGEGIYFVLKLKCVLKHCSTSLYQQVNGGNVWCRLYTRPLCFPLALLGQLDTHSGS